MTDFAQKLRAARAAANLSQQGMADRMLIPRRTIEDWEAGRRTPPPYVQRFVLNGLGELRKLAEYIDRLPGNPDPACVVPEEERPHILRKIFTEEPDA